MAAWVGRLCGLVVWWLGGWWLVGGWLLLFGGWWLVATVWWLVVGGSWVGVGVCWCVCVLVCVGVCVVCVLCAFVFVLFPFPCGFSLFLPLRPLPPGGASSWTLTARRSRWSPEKDEACSDDEHDLNTMEGCANWMLCMFLPKKQGPAAAFGRILLAEHPDAKGRQSQPLVCRVHPNRCERQVVAHKA